MTLIFCFILLICDRIYWVSATVGRLVLAKMWLMTHHPLQYTNSDGSATFSQDIRDRLFVTSVEVIEFACLLENNENTAKWGWLFRTYMQWHAVAFVLSELCARPPGLDYERAWKAVESVYDERVSGSLKSQKGMLWRPMRQLMAKAQTIRAKYRKEGRSITDLASDRSAGNKSNMPWKWRSVDPEGRFLNSGAVIGHMEAFGLFDNPVAIETGASAPSQQQQQFPLDISRQQIDQTPVQRNFSDDDVSQWLAHEQMLQQNPEAFNWSGWNLGISNIGDVPMTDESFSQYQSTAGPQEWF